jgi:hypothetical protein
LTLTVREFNKRIVPNEEQKTYLFFSTFMAFALLCTFPCTSTFPLGRQLWAILYKTFQKNNLKSKFWKFD